MTINIISFSSRGGAGNVSTALANGFRKIGLETTFVVATNSDLRSDPLRRPSVTLAAAADDHIIKSSEWNSLISLSRDTRSSIAGKLKPSELTIFRWMNGVLGGQFLRKNPNLQNVVWGLDDMNPFTGVCHYSDYCEGYKTGCSNCPAVKVPFRGLVSRNLNRKRKINEIYTPKYVAPTDWVMKEFQDSQIGKDAVVEKILNPLSYKFFRSGQERVPDESAMRVLVVAANLDDPTKGIWSIIDALRSISLRGRAKITLVGRHSQELANQLPDAIFPGFRGPDEIFTLMNSHDVLLVPSLFENAGTVVAEAASQGLPSIAREVGGMPEMTNYGSTGFLFSTNEELDNILASITKKDLKTMGLRSKEWAQRLKPELIASRYAEVFLS